MTRPVTRLSRLAIVTLFGAISLTAPAAMAQGSGNCSLEPITLPLSDATPAAIVAATPQPAAAAVEFTEEDAFAAVQLIVDCANESDPALAWAIFTERYLAVQYADPTVTNLPAFEQFIDEGDDRTPGTFALEDVGPITQLDDGRVSVEVTVSSGGTTYANTFVLAQVGDHWLIDDVLDPA